MSEKLTIYVKITGEKQDLEDVKCKCGSVHFHIKIERSGKTATFAVFCTKCKAAIANVWVGDWQIPRDIESKCRNCGSEMFRVQSEYEKSIAVLHIRCNKCGKSYNPVGIGSWQAS